MPFFQYNGVKLHYVDVDNRNCKKKGITLLFIHGAGSSHISWALQLREFSKSHRTIAIDLSGHGQSEDTEGEVSIDEGYTYEVDTLVKHLNLDEFILIGHSMGGGVAMSYVLHDKTTTPIALVLVDTSPDLELSKLATGLVKEAVENKIFLLKSKIFEEYTDTYKIKKYEDELRNATPIVMQRDLVACDKFDISGRISEIDIPTFIIVGENDDIIPPTVVSDFKNRLPRADLAIVRNADHAPMIEQPAEFNRLLQKFIIWVENNH
ncbi:alpha/beta hydrolase [Candidatus Thorarchaeota archaeon]|nr:MAG: alpha/beta hydrolase [Candidatus Thorarchaeota archaeon]